MAGTVYHWIDSLLSVVYPPTCVLCRAPGHRGMDLCSGCLAELPHNPSACPGCALPLPDDHPLGSPCGGCQRTPPLFDHCYGAFLYREPISRLVGGLKFQGHLHYGRLLGELLSRNLRERGAAIPELLIPVPLHGQRMRTRGYNQALEIARWVTRTLAVPLDTESCARTRATAAQSDLALEARRRNLRGAFTLVRPLRARHVAVLDDVVTTGSTVSELARVLKRGGVERVDVWAVARTE